ncbi:hypothetical protein BAE44_0011568 [Dichanthelium oligosanthes]|uniref:Uncharacterized protein n=1 Tax=Dichanthelium oligosanthes TaxID=888268 RepID=A0A1E5VQP9_9POAL|nr:hypothetical protein BAE44_0011568 [Dichanthelium oligosanthes]
MGNEGSHGLHVPQGLGNGNTYSLYLCLVWEKFYYICQERPSIDLIGVAGKNNAHDISAGEEQKQVLLSGPFSGCFRIFQLTPYSLSASMDGHLILSAARRTVLNHGALLLSTHQGSIHDHIAMQLSSAPEALRIASLRPNLLVAMEQGKKQQQRGKLQRVLREQKARLYIIRRCVVMLVFWSD